MKRCAHGVALCLLIVSGLSAYGDELLFRYEGDVLPFDGGGFVVFDPCVLGCAESVQNGAFSVEWSGAGDQVNYDHEVARSPALHPATLWVEWRFRSNFPLPAGWNGCDARARVQWAQIVDVPKLHGDAVVSFDGGSVLSGLALNEFYTLRFESSDGVFFNFAVDGKRFFQARGHPPALDLTSIQFGGFGNCPRPPGQVIRDEWDFIRYGTISDGETILSAEPPEGIVNANQQPGLDRFTVHFDRPGFVYITDVSVQTSAGDPPMVQWVRRPDGSEPETVQIVLDRPLPLNATTIFTLNTGAAEPQQVEYTYLAIAACCWNDGSCTEASEQECLDNGGVFLPDATCEGDLDSDGLDAACGDGCPDDAAKTAPGLCGCGVADLDFDFDTVPDCLDECPQDPEKTTPGQCGCGEPEADSDGDSVADCLDQCPEEDDTVDQDNNGFPDCAQFQPIPTASAWGLAILAILLLITAKLRRIVNCHLSMEARG